MAIMGSRNPEIPKINSLGSLANAYTNFISKPEFENTRNILQGYVDEQEKEALKAQEQERYNTELGFKTRTEERLINKEKEDKERVLATNNALAALLDPDKVTSLNTVASDTTTQNQINMYNQANSDGIVTPQEQALIDARYKEDLSRDVLSNQFADQPTLFNAKKSQDALALQREQFAVDVDYKNRSLAEQAKTRKAQEQRYNEQRLFENEIKRLNFEEKQRNIMDKERNKNLLLEQAIALNLDPNAKSLEQLQSDITEQSKNMDFKRVNVKDEESGETRSILTAVPKPKSLGAIKQEVEEMTKEYTKLRSNVAKNDSGILSSSTNKTLDAAEKAGIPPEIMESILAEVSVVNANNSLWDEEYDFNSDAFSKITYKDPITKQQIPLDVYLKTIAESDVINKYTEKGYKGFGSIVNISDKDKEAFSKELAKRNKGMLQNPDYAKAYGEAYSGE